MCFWIFSCLNTLLLLQNIHDQSNLDTVTQCEIFHSLYDGSWLSEGKIQILKICSTVKVPHIYKGIKTHGKTLKEGFAFRDLVSLPLGILLLTRLYHRLSLRTLTKIHWHVFKSTFDMFLRKLSMWCIMFCQTNALFKEPRWQNLFCMLLKASLRQLLCM